MAMTRLLYLFQNVHRAKQPRVLLSHADISPRDASSKLTSDVMRPNIYTDLERHEASSSILTLNIMGPPHSY